MVPIRLRCAWALLVVVVGARAALGQTPQAGKYSSAGYAVIEARDEKVETRDGARLVVDIFRPDCEGRFPAVLCQTPYNKTGQATRAKWFAQRGYVVVNPDSRGRFESEGQWRVLAGHLLSEPGRLRQGQGSLAGHFRLVRCQLPRHADELSCHEAARWHARRKKRGHH